MSDHQVRGDQLFNLYRYNDALAAYGLALEEEPACPELYLSIGFLFESCGELENALDAYGCGLMVSPAHTKTRFRLGCTLHALGRALDAQAAFEMVVATDEQHAPAYNNLGMIAKSLRRYEEAEGYYNTAIKIDHCFSKARDNLGILLTTLGKTGAAKEVYRASLSLGLEASRASHLLAALLDETPDIAPREYVRQLFDGYCGPEVILRLIKQFAASEHPDQEHVFTNALDLGCGTGMMAQALADLVTNVDGVDLSPKMIEQAQRKKIYRHLYTNNLVDFLQIKSPPTDKYDLIVAADVLIYFGRLAELFEEISAHLQVDGIFVFSVESTESDRYILKHSGRYAHSMSYIQSMAEQAGLTLYESTSAPIRTEQNVETDGFFYVLTPRNAHAELCSEPELLAI
jgi:predicted TPR repeat methyltransferase